MILIIINILIGKNVRLFGCSFIGVFLCCKNLGVKFINKYVVILKYYLVLEYFFIY